MREKKNTLHCCIKEKFLQQPSKARLSFVENDLPNTCTNERKYREGADFKDLT
jgi:hypothetical protein